MVFFLLDSIFADTKYGLDWTVLNFHAQLLNKIELDDVLRAQNVRVWCCSDRCRRIMNSIWFYLLPLRCVYSSERCIFLFPSYKGFHFSGGWHTGCCVYCVLLPELLPFAFLFAALFLTHSYRLQLLSVSYEHFFSSSCALCLSPSGPWFVCERQANAVRQLEIYQY